LIGEYQVPDCLNDLLEPNDRGQMVPVSHYMIFQKIADIQVEKSGSLLKLVLLFRLAVSGPTVYANRIADLFSQSTVK
jgi:hypothetical protein